METPISNKSFFVYNPHANAPCHTTLGSYKPKLGRSISELSLEGCPPKGCKRLVQSRLRGITRWKEDPEKVMGVMGKVTDE